MYVCMYVYNIIAIMSGFIESSSWQCGCCHAMVALVVDSTDWSPGCIRLCHGYYCCKVISIKLYRHYIGDILY